MPGPASLQNDQGKARYYKQLGLEPGAPRREVEAAYWRFARELKGQAAMAPYNEAYEALVAKAPVPADDPEPSQQPVAPAADKSEAQSLRPPSKLGWPR